MDARTKLVAFDLVGTLVSGDLFECARAAAKLPIGNDWRRLEAETGFTTHFNYQRVCRAAVPESLEAADQAYRTFSLYLIANALRFVYPDAREVLEYLDRRRVKIGFVTNGSNSEEREILLKISREFGIRDPIIVTGEDAQARKATTEPFKKLLEKAGELGIQKSEIVFVGDSPEDDIGGPHGIGLRAVQCVRTLRTTLSSDSRILERPDRVVTSLVGLLGPDDSIDSGVEVADSVAMASWVQASQDAATISNVHDVLSRQGWDEREFGRRLVMPHFRSLGWHVEDVSGGSRREADHKMDLLLTREVGSDLVGWAVQLKRGRSHPRLVEVSTWAIQAFEFWPQQRGGREYRLDRYLFLSLGTLPNHLKMQFRDLKERVPYPYRVMELQGGREFIREMIVHRTLRPAAPVAIALHAMRQALRRRDAAAAVHYAIRAVCLGQDRVLLRASVARLDALRRRSRGIMLYDGLIRFHRTLSCVADSWRDPTHVDPSAPSVSIPTNSSLRRSWEIIQRQIDTFVASYLAMPPSFSSMSIACLVLRCGVSTEEPEVAEFIRRLNGELVRESRGLDNGCSICTSKAISILAATGCANPPALTWLLRQKNLRAHGEELDSAQRVNYWTAWSVIALADLPGGAASPGKAAAEGLITGLTALFPPELSPKATVAYWTGTRDISSVRVLRNCLLACAYLTLAGWTPTESQCRTMEAALLGLHEELVDMFKDTDGHVHEPLPRRRFEASEEGKEALGALAVSLAVPGVKVSEVREATHRLAASVERKLGIEQRRRARSSADHLIDSSPDRACAYVEGYLLYWELRLLNKRESEV